MDLKFTRDNATEMWVELWLLIIVAPIFEVLFLVYSISIITVTSNFSIILKYRIKFMDLDKDDNGKYYFPCAFVTDNRCFRLSVTFVIHLAIRFKLDRTDKRIGWGGSYRLHWPLADPLLEALKIDCRLFRFIVHGLYQLQCKLNVSRILSDIFSLLIPLLDE